MNALSRSHRAAPARRWAATLGATALSTYALDGIATAAGAALAACGLLHGAPHSLLLGLLALSYIAWSAGLWKNLGANWELLEQTGTSTNAPSKAAHDLAALRRWSPRARRVAGATGYVGTEFSRGCPTTPEPSAPRW